MSRNSWAGLCCPPPPTPGSLGAMSVCAGGFSPFAPRAGLSVLPGGPRGEDLSGWEGCRVSESRHSGQRLLTVGYGDTGLGSGARTTRAETPAADQLRGLGKASGPCLKWGKLLLSATLSEQPWGPRGVTTALRPPHTSLLARSQGQAHPKPVQLVTRPSQEAGWPQVSAQRKSCASPCHQTSAVAWSSLTPGRRPRASYRWGARGSNALQLALGPGFEAGHQPQSVSSFWATTHPRLPGLGISVPHHQVQLGAQAQLGWPQGHKDCPCKPGLLGGGASLSACCPQGPTASPGKAWGVPATPGWTSHRKIQQGE